MWPRFAEMLIGAWLAASPFVFHHSVAHRALWISDWACAAAIVACAALSFWHPLRRLHLAQLLIVLWLIGFGFLASPEPLPALQNNILVALVLPMFAIIPNHSNQPPAGWKAVVAVK